MTKQKDEGQQNARSKQEAKEESEAQLRGAGRSKTRQGLWFKAISWNSHDTKIWVKTNLHLWQCATSVIHLLNHIKTDPNQVMHYVKTGQCLCARLCLGSTSN